MNYGTYSSYIGVYRLYNNRRGRGRYRGRVGALYPTPLHLVSLLRLAFERAGERTRSVLRARTEIDFAIEI